MAFNFINMEDKWLSKIVIASICIMTSILMLIITDSVYIFNALAQTDETDIETNRIIDRQRTPSSGENPTDDVGNAPPQTYETDIETHRIIDRQRTPSSGENATDDVGNAPPQTNETDIETNETDIETNETDIETNETDIETNRIIIRQRTPSSGENATDDVGNALIMPSRIINNVGGVAIDKFANIFIADNGIISF
jgi:hypothetical protein